MKRAISVQALSLLEILEATKLYVSQVIFTKTGDSHCYFRGHQGRVSFFLLGHYTAVGIHSI